MCSWKSFFGMHLYIGCICIPPSRITYLTSQSSKHLLKQSSLSYRSTSTFLPPPVSAAVILLCIHVYALSLFSTLITAVAAYLQENNPIRNQRALPFPQDSMSSGWYTLVEREGFLTQLNPIQRSEKVCYTLQGLLPV